MNTDSFYISSSNPATIQLGAEYGNKRRKRDDGYPIGSLKRFCYDSGDGIPERTVVAICKYLCTQAFLHLAKSYNSIAVQEGVSLEIVMKINEKYCVGAKKANGDLSDQETKVLIELIEEKASRRESISLGRLKDLLYMNYYSEPGAKPVLPKHPDVIKTAAEKFLNTKNMSSLAEGADRAHNTTPDHRRTSSAANLRKLTPKFTACCGWSNWEKFTILSSLFSKRVSKKEINFNLLNTKIWTRSITEIKYQLEGLDVIVNAPSTDTKEPLSDKEIAALIQTIPISVIDADSEGDRSDTHSRVLNWYNLTNLRYYSTVSNYDNPPAIRSFIKWADRVFNECLLTNRLNLSPDLQIQLMGDFLEVINKSEK